MPQSGAEERAGRVVVVGALNMDLVIVASRFPEPGETFEGDRFYTAPGGKGANQAVAAARMAGRPGLVEMVGRVGSDVFGTRMLQILDQCGVGRTGVEIGEGESSGIALIFIDGSGENYVLPVYGANGLCGPRQAADAGRVLDGASVLLVQQETPLEATLAAMQAARRHGVTVVLDPAPTRAQTPEDFLEPVDIITPNRLEATQMTGIEVDGPRDAAQAAQVLRDRGLPAAIVTLGAEGSFVATDGFTGFVPVFDVRPVATVAAGDAFNGGLAAGLASGMSLEEAVHLASAGAALSVTRPGAQESMPTRQEAEDLLSTRST